MTLRMNSKATDEEAIRRVVSTYVDTWNQNDMESWGKLFTDDVDYVNRGGGWWRSNRENVEGHKRIHDYLVKHRQVMDYQSTVENIAFLTTETALVHASWTWPSARPPTRSEEFKGMITMVLVKRGGAWLIRALQNTVTTGPNP